jgi:rhamnogalacturonan endolyase
VVNAESVTLNGGAVITGNLLVPGTPTLRLNGNPNFGGTVTGPGNSQPTNHQITLNGSATLGHLLNRIDPVALPTVVAPPTPTGTRDVTISQPSGRVGDPATLRNLTLNGNVGMVAVPAGTYGTFISNGGSGFILGVEGSTTPAVYNLQSLNLNGNSQIQIVGPVILTLANGTAINSSMGNETNPLYLQLRIAAGGLNLNGGSTFNGTVIAPNGTVIVNGSATLTGSIAADQLIVNGGGLLKAVGQ